MALDYIQGLAQVGAMEMSDTGNCPSVRSWIHVIIMNAHLPDLQSRVFFFSFLSYWTRSSGGSGVSERVLLINTA